MRRSKWIWAAALVAAGCASETSGNIFSNEDGAGDTLGEGSDSGADGMMEAGEDESGEDDAGEDSGMAPKLDVGPSEDMGGLAPTCQVVDDMDAVGECGTEAPPNSFEPDVQWSWGDGVGVDGTPLVANLTDDNDDGSIDLCDIPDIVITTGGLASTIRILDGATGQEINTFGGLISGQVNPALGDIDGDGIPEIVAATAGLEKRVIVFEHDGTQKWIGEGTWSAEQGGALAIADLDNDGNPEILADGLIVDNTGKTVFQAPEQVGWAFFQKNTTPIAADLDDDGSLEFILGQAAYTYDGVEIWQHDSVKPGYAQIANLDDDDDPEVLINNWDGITVLEHDGTIKVANQRPSGDPIGIGYWFRPSTVHDFNGDGVSDFAVSSAESYSVYNKNMQMQWSTTVQDGSGWAAGTAFDFLGDGKAEAMYADEVSLFIYDDAGQVLLQVPRSSKTLIEYPVVADVDNDGSSEIVVVSSPDFDSNQSAPGVQVIRDIEDRWIQARRIWNQHTYHVTNVREDGTIPQYEQPSWQLLNTYRTNAQIENGSVCQPQPVG